MGIAYLLITGEINMSSEDIDVYLEQADGITYIESLVRCRVLLAKIPEELDLIDKFNKVISLELDLAISGANKALAEARKTDNVRPIK